MNTVSVFNSPWIDLSFNQYIQTHGDQNVVGLGYILDSASPSVMSRENVDCDDALQTGVGSAECLDETNVLIKYFWNTT